MQEKRTTQVVYTFRTTRSSVVVGLLGLVALVVGIVAPAQAGDHSGKGRTDKPWICHPVEGNGETGTGWNLIAPDQASKHIDEGTGVGFHTRKDGRTDVYAVSASGRWTCPGGPTSSTTSHTTKPTSHTTTSHTTKPTSHTTKPTSHTTKPTSTGTSSTTTTTTTTSSSTPSTTESPDTGATTPAVTTTTRPVASPTSPEEAPFVPSAPEATTPEQPQAAPVSENAVPAAATDGNDLAGSALGTLRHGLLAAGVLLLAAAAMLSVRRKQIF